MPSRDKKRIITIAGRPGSGKSTAAKAVAAKLGYKHFSSGDLYRQLAHNEGVELLQANISVAAHKKLDPLVDSKLQEIGREKNDLVIDSRLAWHWIPNSFKVFIELDLQTAAKRILSEISQERAKNENIIDDPKEYSKILENRLEKETIRYREKYGINPYDMSNYDLIINSGHHSSEQTASHILKSYEEWIKE